MRYVSFIALAVLAGSAFADPLPAGYKPGFSGANLDAPSHMLNQDVTMVVQGIGACDNFKIDWNDGHTDIIATYDFGYGASLKPLIVKHQYAKVGVFYPYASEIKGPTLSQQCGAASPMPISHVQITELPAGYKPGFSGANLDAIQHTLLEQTTMAVTGIGTCENFKVDWNDGTSDTIASFDFGYGATLKPLIAKHHYTKVGTYYPSVSQITGPSLAMQCGSRSPMPNSHVSIIAAPLPIIVQPIPLPIRK